ncbi:hypothetical protein SAMN05444166_1473 [Singulisphaera sp. GP187]|uniref:hypothetical protein n=1 Tax=Singulisphaera sp. GP187 TaxID=1882752 RepID=UPI000927312A|nr:hypothetical protein [Singulisphaera sp. GP187]SIN89201.1 hypothetical protein SAMN05444166_1473 [Singulisphaera sp. GP187]
MDDSAQKIFDPASLSTQAHAYDLNTKCSGCHGSLLPDTDFEPLHGGSQTCGSSGVILMQPGDWESPWEVKHGEITAKKLRRIQVGPTLPARVVRLEFKEHVKVAGGGVLAFAS